jgi:4-amino-4-deoxy-L-arabinose transferase-like glycosyltransferase
MRRPWTLLLVAGSLASLLRLAAFAAADRPGQLFWFPDSAEYDRLAWNLVANGSYSLKDSAPWTPDLTRTPVYPFFVAGCYWLAEGSPTAAVAVQIVCGAATVLLLGIMGRCFFSPQAGLAGAVLLALDPLSIQYATLLLSETLFTLLFVASLYCLLAYLRKPGRGWVSAAALLMGLAILCRPIAVFWPLALLPGAVLLAWKGQDRRPMGHFVVFLAGVAAVIGPWILRNYCIGGLVVLTTIPGINLYYHRAAVLVAEQQGLTVEEAQVRLANRLQEVVRREHLTPQQEYHVMARWGQEIVTAAPRQYVGAHLGALASMFLPEPQRRTIAGLGPTGSFWLEVAFLMIVYGLGLTGFIRGLCRPGRLRFLLLGAVLAYFAVLSGPEAYERFRVPIMPVIMLLAGAGLTSASCPQLWVPRGNFEDGPARSAAPAPGHTYCKSFLQR